MTDVAERDVDLKRAAELTRDELLANLGRVGFEAAPRHPVDRGREIYRTLRVTLQDKLCGDPDLQRLATSSEHRQAELIVALYDLIATVTHGVPIGTLTMLLIRDGLGGLCEDRWTSGS